MNIFISWSGNVSKDIAEVLWKWIPQVVQAAKPWYSPDDISKGSRWNTELSNKLDSTEIGIFCLTRDNLNSPWIMFEAGALSKNVETSKVCPLLFGIDPSDISGPLVQFQAARFSKMEMKRLIKMINDELGDKSLGSTVLENGFDKWWPDLKMEIDNVLSESKTLSDEDVRGDREILEETLSLVRELTHRRRKALFDAEILIDSLNSIILSAQYLFVGSAFPDTSVAIVFFNMFTEHMNYIISDLSSEISQERQSMLNKAMDQLMKNYDEYMKNQKPMR